MSSPTYVVDHKRGEVNELKALLNNPKLTREPEKKREILKKVIAYMTLGIDVSRLFGEMTMAAATKDMVQKKMVYHFLCNYAQQKSDLAILAINTLQKDCRDEDPMVRGLALRSLCSLRLPNLNEYVLIPLRSSLADPSPYVRKTAVVGIAKLYQYAPDVVRNSDLVDILYNMLKDRDTTVISNSLQALNEILASEGGMAINQNIILYLLNRIKEFNEWGQCAILDLVAKYKPRDDNEMFDIMNLLEERLKHSNSAVVFGTTKVFLLFTEHIPSVHQEVYKRLKAPLLTLMGGGSFELAYSVLGHVALLVQRAPHIFNDSYKHFFCRFNDPSCVKQLKLQITTDLATDKNFADILTELAEYVTDIDTEISRFAVRSIGRVAIKIPQATDEAVEHLLSFLDLQTDSILSETMIVLKDLLRKYPERFQDVIPSIQKAFQQTEETEGRVSVIWIIGEYGETIEDAPYILEEWIDKFEDEDSHAIRMELLTAAMKLFFKRPPEVQNMLGRLLSKAIADTGKIDVRDRALLYYRLLSLDVHEAARVVNCPKVVVDVFAESEDNEVKNAVFHEFNTLSVVYGMPAERFIKRIDEEEKRKLEEEEKAQQAAQANSNATSSILSESERSSDDVSEAVQSPNGHAAASAPAPRASSPSPPPAAAAAGSLDLLSEFGFSAPAPVAAPVSRGPAIQFQPNITLDKATYAQKWGSLPVAATIEMRLRPGAILSAPIEAALSVPSILTFASGTVGTTIKLYLFARSTGSALFLIEAIVDTTSGALRATVKSEGADGGAIQAAVEVFKSAIQPLI